MAGCTGDGFSISAGANKLSALFHCPNRHISGEPRMGVAQGFRLDRIVRYFNNAVANGLGARLISGQWNPHAALSAGFWNSGGFTHRDPRRPFQRGEIVCGLDDFIVCHCLGEGHHLLGIAFAAFGARTHVVLHVVQLTDDVFPRQTCGAGIFRTSLAIGIMAKRTGHDATRLIAFGNDFRQRRMVVREPVCRRRAVRRVIVHTTPNLIQRELQL